MHPSYPRSVWLGFCLHVLCKTRADDLICDAWHKVTSGLQRRKRVALTVGHWVLPPGGGGRSWGYAGPAQDPRRATRHLSPAWRRPAKENTFSGRFSTLTVSSAIIKTCYGAVFFLTACSQKEIAGWERKRWKRLVSPQERRCASFLR